MSGDPATVLALALEAADGKDVRLGGGADTVRQFLDAGLIDRLHVAVAPVELGAGSRLWDSPDELVDRYHRDVVPSPSGVGPPPVLARLTEPQSTSSGISISSGVSEPCRPTSVAS